MMQTTTPVPVEGGVAGGALFLSAGTSFSQYDGPQNVILLPIGSIFRPIRQGARVDREATDRPAPDLAKAFFGGVTQPPATTSLRVEVPTLVVWGMKDPYQLPGLLEGLDAYVPDLRLLRIEDAGHYPMQTHAEQVTRARREFFSLRSRCRTGVSRTPLLRRPAVPARRSITRAMSAAAWDVLIACLGQLRLAPSGHVVGIDMSVALRLLDGDLGFGR